MNRNKSSRMGSLLYSLFLPVAGVMGFRPGLVTFVQITTLLTGKKS